MSNGSGRIKVFSNNASKTLGNDICRYLSVKPGDVHLGRFKDPEIECQILENVRGDDVFIVADTRVPAENRDEAIMLAEAARLSSAARVTYVLPYVSYARADRKDAPRKPVSIALMFRWLESAKPNRFIVLDIHAEQSLTCIQDAVYDHLYGSYTAIPRLTQYLAKKDFVVAAPDHGGVKRASVYAKHLGKDDIVYFSKMRAQAGLIKDGSVRIIGDVEGKVVLLVDDMIDSGGTMIADAIVAKEAGAASVIVFATHGLFTDGAVKNIEASPIERVFVTDSVWHAPDSLARRSKKIEFLSVAELLAQAIRRTHDGQSLSEIIL